MPIVTSGSTSASLTSKRLRRASLSHSPAAPRGPVTPARGPAAYHGAVAVSAHAGGSFQTLEPSSERTIVVPFSALRRFFVRVAVLTAVIGVPATLATFVISNRQTPVYLAEATLLAPTAQSSSSPAFDLLEQPLPSESEPLMPEAYGSALTSFDVLQDAWRRLHPNDGEPTPQQLRGLADSVDFRFDTLRRSTLVVVGAEGSTPVEAIARANSVSEALVAWDDSRARA